ncbi:uncharacterized protein LOC125873801 [Solanum stenotomum]|uniref:uncharacterized protein LOC125873801 n=1 Tax=Solanum stenotomum TaxID=172797 RepID=UPI0020D05485|nr:uncharacterized protein LOC125873801 [Solanum stenotomum]
MVNAQELEAQRQRLGLEAEVAARGVKQNGGNNQPRVRQPIAPRGRAQHPAHMMYDEDDANLDGAGATGAIVLPALPPGVKFTITSTMIQLLNLKGMFRGAAGDDANQHLMNFVAICKSQEIPGVNQTAMRLRLFPLFLTGEATNWLNEMPDDSIRTWNELKETFLERFLPESKELQMKDEISTHKQLPGEAMHDTWWRFSQKLKKCPNHDLTERHLKQDFYRSLNYVTKSFVDAVCGGSFMRKPFAESIQLLDEVSMNNRAWYTRDAEVGELGYTFELSTDQRKREEERDQDMTHMRTQIDLLTEHIVDKSEKVNAVGQQHKYEDQDLDIDEDANYLGNQEGFQNYNSGNQGYDSGNAGRSYASHGQYEWPANRDQGNWKNREGYKNDRSGVYVPPGNRDWVRGSSNGSKLEDMMAKVLQNVESTDAGVKEIRDDFSSMSIKYEQVLEQAKTEEDENIQPRDMNVITAIEMVTDEDMRVPIEERMVVETLTAVLMNFDVDFRSDYVETVNALQDLNEEQVQKVIKVLKSYKRAIGWTIADIIGIPPGICTHKIQLEEDCSPSIEHQRSHWVSPVQCVPKKGGMTVVANAKNELVPQRPVTGWRVCID